MTVRVEWDNADKNVLRYDFEGDWNWSEFRAASEDAFALTRSAEHTVDAISYFEPGARLPPNALLQFRRAMAAAPPNRGLNVIVGASTVIRIMVSVYSSVYKQHGKRIVVVNSLEEARALLAVRNDGHSTSAK